MTTKDALDRIQCLLAIAETTDNRTVRIVYLSPRDAEALRVAIKEMKGDEMTFEEYAELAGQTAVYPRRGDNLVYAVLGLAGEAGELANQLKKVIRDDAGDIKKRHALLAAEIGDVLWYCAAVSHELGIPLKEIAAANVAKLHARQTKGTLCGDGDKR